MSAAPRALRLTAPTVPESAIQDAILDYLRHEMHRNGRVVRLERRNSGTLRRYDGTYGAPAYRLYLPGVPSPLSRGVEDLVGVLRDGRHFGIECKSQSGDMRKEQTVVQRAAEKAGLLHLVARSVDDVREWLDRVAPRLPPAGTP